MFCKCSISIIFYSFLTITMQMTLQRAALQCMYNSLKPDTLAWFKSMRAIHQFVCLYLQNTYMAWVYVILHHQYSIRQIGSPMYAKKGVSLPRSLCLKTLNKNR
jgi:hypothetical protein